MSAHPLRGSAAIVGMGMAGLGEAPGRGHLELLHEAATIALADAGLTLDDVDGLFTATLNNYFPALTIAEHLGVRASVVDGTNIGGSSALQHVISAVTALQAGLCQVALVAYGSNQRTASGRLVNLAELPPYEERYAPRYPVSAYAMATQRHMHEFGTSREQLAQVAVAARAWAALNPDAFMREPLTIADVLASRMVCDPLRVRDCCLVTDGAAALVLVSAARARDFPRPPVWFLGGGYAAWHRQISSMPGLTATAARDSGNRAFAMAGLGPGAVDQLQLYDCFTITPILFLEDLGFCPKGEGGRFVAGGRIAPGGALPVNTNGGGLSFGHPGMYGIYTLCEAVTQVRRAAGARQQATTDVVLCHGNGGTLSSQVTVILGSNATV